VERRTNDMKKLPVWWNDEHWKDKELIQMCDCYSHVVTLGMLWDGELEDEWAYLSVFYALHPYEWSWKQRLGYIWRILTGNVSAVWEVILSREKALRIADFIKGCAELQDEETGGAHL